MVFDCIIVGAGPTGLEAALQARDRGLTYRLIDELDAGSLIERTMANKKFYHVYGRNSAPHRGLLAFPDRVKGLELVKLWKEQAKALNFQKNESLTAINRQGETFEVTTNRETYRCRFVILTSGTFEHPKTLGLPGEADNPKVHYALDYYEEYRGEKIVIVGGGNSAVETAVYAAPHNQTTLVVRKDHLRDSVTPLNRKAVDELVAAGKLTISWGGTVESIAENELTIKTHNQTTVIPYDRLFIQIGFRKPTEFLTGLGIELRDEQPVLTDQFETNIPGLYIAGALTGADSIVECADQSIKIIHHLQHK